MYRVIADKIGPALHPSEIAAYFTTADGRSEEFILSSRSIDERNSVEIGFPVGRREDGAMLVELGREASSGTWRIWTKPEKLLRTTGDVILIAGMAEDEFVPKADGDAERQTP